MGENALRWSRDVQQADWIGPRLASWDDGHTITIVVPAGFEAYARVLHPVETADNGDRLVRWAERDAVAAGCAVPLDRAAAVGS